MWRFVKRSPWIVLGGAAVWFLDPERGPQRREELKQWFDGNAKQYSSSSSPTLGDTVAA